MKVTVTELKLNWAPRRASKHCLNNPATDAAHVKKDDDQCDQKKIAKCL